MEKAEIRLVRIDKEVYWLHGLAQNYQSFGATYDETTGLFGMTLRSDMGVRIAHVVLSIGFPEGFPVEAPAILIKDWQKGSWIRMQELQAISLELIQNWNVSDCCASLIQSLVASIRSRYELTLRGRILRPFEIVRNHRWRQKQQLQKVKKRKVGSKRRVFHNSSTEARKHHMRNEQNIQTKNLNRHFRSKLREILREFKEDAVYGKEADKLYKYFKPNCVGFKQISHVLKIEWFNCVLHKELSNGNFLRRILQSVMGIQSKQLMIKYYPIIEHAVQHPDKFVRWKY